MRILSVEYGKKDGSCIVVADVEEKTNVILNCTLDHVTKEEFVNIAIDINRDLNCDKFVCEDIELYYFIKEVYNGRL